MTAIAFNHVALNCRDMAATERYYSQHFGFRRARVIPLGESEIVFLKAGDFYLELFAAEEFDHVAAEGDGPHAQGIRHLAFQVDDIDGVISAMGEAAQITLGPLDFSDFIPGWRTVWVADPEGNVIEISQGFVDQVGLS